MTSRALFALLALTLLPACKYNHIDGDLVVHNAHIVSLDAEEKVYQAMAIKDGRILELGAEQQIRNKYNATETYNAAGQWIYPGFIDGHCHFLGYGLNKQKVDLLGCTSADDLLARVETFAKAHPDKEWIIGRGWDQNDWAVKLYPDNARLNELFPDRPVLLQRIDGHAALVNDAALLKTGLDLNKQIDGGQMLMRDGRFTGILVDNAVEVFQKIFDDAPEPEKRKALLEAQRDCFAAGLTGVHDAGLDIGTIELIEKMQAEGVLKMRINAMVADQPGNLEHFAKRGVIKTDRLRVGTVKVYGDGALGSRGALLLEPYADDSTHHGLMLHPREHFAEVAQWCMANNYQMATHCIGDSANRLVLDVYGEVLKQQNDKRWRIEHAQVVDPADQQLFTKYNVIPSVQPTHATSDAPWAGVRLGDARLPNAYACKQLQGAIGMLALGTDFPVEAIDPLATYFAAVERTPKLLPSDAPGIYPYMPDQALSRIDALRGMTIWNAIAAFEEAEKGTLEVGKLADFVVVDRDLLKVSAEQLRKARVLATYVGGEAVSER
ncbi:MAG: amidohydrolase [Flavobacteriales bacterium]|nr:MAG: amidohydrolase [Flavobacteriales bacterium]